MISFFLRSPKGVLFALALSVASGEALTPSQEGCVQYHARKTMFLFKKEQVWGINCKLVSEVQKEESGVSLKLTIPVEKFESGNSQRDEDVRHMLKFAEHPLMTFVSEKMQIENLKTILSSPDAVNVPGSLRIGGVQHPVEFKVSSQKIEADGGFLISGRMETTFTHFQLAPPKVGGGLIAKADDWLELEVQLNTARIPGAAEVLK